MRENLEQKALISTTATTTATTTKKKPEQQKLESSLFSIFIPWFLHAQTHVTTHNLQRSVHMLLRSTDAENIRLCESFVTTGLSVQEERTGR